MIGKDEAVALFVHSVDGMLLTRPDGSILAANLAACTIFGFSEDELIALGRSGVVDTGDPRVGVLVAQRKAQQGHQSVALFYWSRHGRPRIKNDTDR